MDIIHYILGLLVICFFKWLTSVPKMPLGRFSGAISGQPMVDPGRSEGEDSDGGGLDGRRWLTRENRRFEPSVADANRGPFPAK